jgi:beta-glucanase (GH16 family)
LEFSVLRATTLTILTIITVAAVWPSQVFAADAEPKPGWKLVWQDEFDGSSLSPHKWNKLVREQSKHNELQYYVPDEAYLEKGSLRLRSRVRDYGTQHYTSGRVDTSGKFSPVYGRFEIRGKLPNGQGMWPAYWLYPQNRDWPMEQLMARAVAEGRERQIPEARPWYTEMDIMEFLGHEPKTLYATFHFHSFDGQKKSSSSTFKSDVDYTKDFHVYAFEWDPDEMRWYVDDKQIHSTKKSVPHEPHYLILNTAVGGQWPGNPNDTTVFPQYHDIDYVHVYQRPEYFSGK